jgi:hypothetical protein
VRVGGISRSCALGACLAPIGGLLPRSAIHIGPREHRVKHRRERRKRINRYQGRALAVPSALPRVRHPPRQRADRRVGQFAEDVVAVGARDRLPDPHRSAVQRVPPIVDRLPDRWMGTM